MAASGTPTHGKKVDLKPVSTGYSGYISVDLDHALGVIRVRGVGMWTPQQAQVYFDEMARIIEPLHALKVPSRSLIDLRDAPVQSAATAEEMAKGSFRHDPLTDRVAFICSSKLFALQIRRSVPFMTASIFETEEDALAWLLSDQPGDMN